MCQRGATSPWQMDSHHLNLSAKLATFSGRLHMNVAAIQLRQCLNVIAAFSLPIFLEAGILGCNAPERRELVPPCHAMHVYFLICCIWQSTMSSKALTSCAVPTGPYQGHHEEAGHACDWGSKQIRGKAWRISICVMAQVRIIDAAAERLRKRQKDEACAITATDFTPWRQDRITHDAQCCRSQADVCVR